MSQPKDGCFREGTWFGWTVFTGIQKEQQKNIIGLKTQTICLMLNVSTGKGREKVKGSSFVGLYLQEKSSICKIQI